MRTFSGDKELGVSDLKKKRKEKKKEHKSRAKRATVLRRRYRKKRKKRTAWEGGGNNKMGRRRCRRRIKRCRRRPFALASDRIVKPKIHQSARTLLFLSSIRFEDRFTFDSLSLLFQYDDDGQKKVQEEQKLLFPKAKAEMIKKNALDQSQNRKLGLWRTFEGRKRGFGVRGIVSVETKGEKESPKKKPLTNMSTPGHKRASVNILDNSGTACKLSPSGKSFAGRTHSFFGGSRRRTNGRKSRREK